MERFRKILAYVDPAKGECAAFARAVRLCERGGAQLTLLAVVPELSVYLRYPQFSYPSLGKTLAEEAQGGLSDLAAKARERGVDVLTKVRNGKAFLEITREALAGGHDLVMLTADEEGAMGRSASTAMQLFRVCPCPVWAVRPAHAEPFTRILAAVDPSAQEQQERGLNQEILERALSLGKLEGARVDALHAWDDHLAATEFHKPIAALARSSLLQLLKPYGPDFPEGTVHLVAGDAASAITGFVEENGIDLLVMGTLVRTGVAGFLMGNTAEKVLGRVECSVLALKPAGFESPVEEDSEKE